MANLIGLLIIILVFGLSYFGLSYLNMLRFRLFIFWLGFLLLLRPCKNIPLPATQIQWARIGLLSNILANALFAGLIASGCGNYLAYLALQWIASPITSIFKMLSPYLHIKLSSGAYLIYMSPVRAMVTSLLDICLYIGIGLLIGRFIGSCSGKSR